MKSYSYNVFTIYYGIKFYPLCISLSSGIDNELENYLEDIDVVDLQKQRYRINDEEAFIEILEKILNTKELAVIIRNMNILAREQVEADDSVEIEVD